MHINELKNLVVLARRGIAVDANINANEAQIAWTSIAAAEGFIQNIAESERAKQSALVTEDNAEGTESTFTVVDIDENGDAKEVEPQDSSCNTEESCDNPE
jgi:hypothetical protein